MRTLLSLLEGLSLKGNVFHFDKKGEDEPIFKGFTSTGNDKIHKQGFKINLSANKGGTPDEEDEIRDALKKYPGVFQKFVPAYFAYVLEKAVGKHKNADLFDQFAKSLKGKHSTHDFDPSSLQNKMSVASNYILKILKKDFDLSKFDNIIVLPAPSGSDLPKNFASVLSSELRKVAQDKVHFGMNYLKRASNPKFSPISKRKQFHTGSALVAGVDRGTKKDIPKFEKRAGRKIQYPFGRKVHKFSSMRESILESILRLDEYDFEPTRYHWEQEKRKKKGDELSSNEIGAVWQQLLTPGNVRMYGEDRINNMIQNRKKQVYSALEKVTKDLQNASGKEYASLLYKKNAYKTELKRLPHIEKSANFAIKKEKNKGWNGKSSNVNQSVGKLGSYRHHVYDNTDVNKKDIETHDKINAQDAKNLIILADDNIDTNKTINDIYTKLFKNGLIGKNTKFIAAAMYKMHDATSGPPQESYKGYNERQAAKEEQDRNANRTHKETKTISNPLDPPEVRLKSAEKDAKEEAQYIKDYNDEAPDIIYNIIKDHNISHQQANDILKKAFDINASAEIKNIEKSEKRKEKQKEKEKTPIELLNKWFRANPNANRREFVEKGVDLGLPPLRASNHFTHINDLGSTDTNAMQALRSWFFHNLDASKTDFMKKALEFGIHPKGAQYGYNKAKSYIDFHRKDLEKKYSAQEEPDYEKILQQNTGRGGRKRKGQKESEASGAKSREWLKNNQDKSKEEFVEKAKQFGWNNRNTAVGYYNRVMKGLPTKGDSDQAKMYRWFLRNPNYSTKEAREYAESIGVHWNNIRNLRHRAKQYLEFHDLRTINESMTFINFLLIES